MAPGAAPQPAWHCPLGWRSPDGPHFNENLPLRDGIPLDIELADGTGYTLRSPLMNTVPGATAIQEHMDNFEWIQQAGEPVPYAAHLRRAPLEGMAPKSVLVQIAKGDQNLPNPAQSALIRAGDLADRTVHYRNDLAFAEDPTLPKNPHSFTNPIADPNPFVAAIARGSQEQVAIVFASDGADVIHPEPRRFFEVPIVLPLPEGLNFIP